MTRERLEQYDSLLQELQEEQERLARETRHAQRMEETYGVGCLFGAAYLEEARGRVQVLAAQREDESAEVQQWIASIRDSMTRRALRLRYLDCLTWADVAIRMGYADESGPRKLVDRALIWEA